MSSIVSSSTASLNNTATRIQYEEEHNDSSSEMSISNNDDSINIDDRRSGPVTMEPIHGTNSVIITKVSTDDTMSSSPASYTSNKNPLLNIASSTSISGARNDKQPSVIQTPKEEQDDDEKQVKWASNNRLNNNRNTDELLDNNLNNNVKDTDDDFVFNSSNIVTLPTDKLIKMLTALLEKIVHSNDRLNVMQPSNIQEHNTITNMRNSDTQSSTINSIISFKGKHVPQIGFEQYFHRIQKYCPTTNDVYLSLLIYFDRISKKCNSKLENDEFINNKEKESSETPEEHDNETEDSKRDNNINNNEESEGAETKQHQVFVMDSYNIHRLIIAGITVSTKFFSDFFYSNSRYARVGGISLKEMNHLELQFLVLCDFELIVTVEEMERYANLLYRFWSNDNHTNNHEADDHK